jgi:hypothetical protein
VLAFANMMHFLADELSSLRRCRLAGTLVRAGTPQRFLLGHIIPPIGITDATAMPRAGMRIAMAQ